MKFQKHPVLGAASCFGSTLAVQFVLAVPLTMASTLSFADLLEEEVFELPTVITPTKLKQARTEVPAAVTVITREMIEASGIRELPEIFRLVPGMVVGEKDGWNYIVGQHGAHINTGKRIQVLIDGRSIHPVGIIAYRWTDIPIAMEDIERIEVTRGPNSASYGADSSLGVINIITSHPGDQPGFYAKAVAGSENTEDYLLRYSHSTEHASFRLTAQTRRDSGFDMQEPGFIDPLDLTQIGPRDNRDNKDVSILTSRFITRVSDNTTVDVQAGYNEAEKQEDAQISATFDTVSGSFLLDDFYPKGPDYNNRKYFTSIKTITELSSNHEIMVQLDHTHHKENFPFHACASDFSLGLGSNGWLVCGDLDENTETQRTDLQIQNTHVASERIRSVSGIVLGKHKADSETYFRGKAERSTAQLFGNVEIQPNDSINLNIGGSIEKDEGLDVEFSPRLAANWLVAENQSLRLIYAKAFRTPGLIDTDGQWNTTARNLYIYDIATDSILPGQWAALGLPDPIVIDEKSGNPDVQSEPIISWQLGYYGNFQPMNLEVDVNYFIEEINDVIYTGVSLGSFNPGFARGYIRNEGVQVESTWRPNSDFRLSSSFAFMDTIIEDTSKRELDITAHFTASLQADWAITPSSRFSSTYYYADEINEFTFQRIDVRFAQKVPIGSSELTFAPVLIYRFDNDPEYFRDNLYEHDTSFLVEVSLQI